MTTHPDTATVEETNQLQRGCPSRSSLAAPPANYSQFDSSQFAVDWCEYRQLNLGTPVTEAPPSGRGTGSDLPPAVPSEESSVWTVIIIAVVAGVLMALVTCITTYVCCSRRRYA